MGRDVAMSGPTLKPQGLLHAMSSVIAPACVECIRPLQIGHPMVLQSPDMGGLPNAGREGKRSASKANLGEAPPVTKC